MGSDPQSYLQAQYDAELKQHTPQELAKELVRRGFGAMLVDDVAHIAKK